MPELSIVKRQTLGQPLSITKRSTIEEPAKPKEAPPEAPPDEVTLGDYLTNIPGTEKISLPNVPRPQIEVKTIEEPKAKPSLQQPVKPKVNIAEYQKAVAGLPAPKKPAPATIERVPTEEDYTRAVSGLPKPPRPASAEVKEVPETPTTPPVSTKPKIVKQEPVAVPVKKASMLGKPTNAEYNSQLYNQQVLQTISKQVGVDHKLLTTVGLHESSLHHDTTPNEAGAVGLMQLLPSTADWFKVNINDLWDNAKGGALYLKWLLARYNGDVRKALIGYHAGPGEADKNPTDAELGPKTKAYVTGVLKDLGQPTPKLQGSSTSSLKIVNRASTHPELQPGAVPKPPALPEPDLLGRAVRFGNQTVQNVWGLGRAIKDANLTMPIPGVPVPTTAKGTVELMEAAPKPLLPVSELFEPGAAKGVAEGVETLSSPATLAIMGSATAATTAAPVLGYPMMMYFTKDMLQGAWKQYEEAKVEKDEALRRQRYAAAATQGVLALFPVLKIGYDGFVRMSRKAQVDTMSKAMEEHVKLASDPQTAPEAKAAHTAAADALRTEISQLDGTPIRQTPVAPEAPAPVSEPVPEKAFEPTKTSSLEEPKAPPVGMKPPEPTPEKGPPTLAHPTEPPVGPPEPTASEEIRTMEAGVAPENSSYLGANQAAGQAPSPGHPAPIVPELTQPPSKTVELAVNPNEVVRQDVIYRQLVDALGRVPLVFERPRSWREGVLGDYDAMTELMRVGAFNDQPTVFHEMAHHAATIIWGKDRTNKWWQRTGPLAPYASELSKISTYAAQSAKKDPELGLIEGFAEFMRKYVTDVLDPGFLDQVAPNTKAFVEVEMQRFPEVWEAFQRAKNDFTRWTQQPATYRFLGKMGTGENAYKTPKDWNQRAGETFSWTMRNVVDRLHPFKQAVEYMSKEAGKEQPDSENGYTLLRLLHGNYGRVQHFLERGPYDPLTGNVTGKPLRDIILPVKDKLQNGHAYLSALRAMELESRGIESGFDKADARQTFLENDTPLMRQHAQEMWKFNDDVVSYLVGKRLLGPLDQVNWNLKNQLYVPFHRIAEDFGEGSARSWRRVHGGQWNIENVYEAQLQNLYTLIPRAERNAALLAFVDQASKSPKSAQFVRKVDRPLQQIKFNLAEVRKQLGTWASSLSNDELTKTLEIFRPVWNADKSGERVVTIMRDGKPEYWKFNETLFQALRAGDELNGRLLGPLLRVLGAPARALRLGATGLNPEFFLFRNPFRDQMTAWVQSQSKALFGSAPGIDLVRGVFHVLNRDDLFWEWKRSGGDNASMIGMDRVTLQKNLSDLLATKKGFAWRHPLEALRTVADATEAATRIMEFERLKGEGVGLETAGLASRDVTLDFQRRGNAVMSAWNSIASFFGAQINGTQRFIAAHGGKQSSRTMLRAVTGVTIPTLLLYWASHDDPEYQRLPRFQKDMCWNIPTKWLPFVHENLTPFIPIPRLQLYGMVYGTMFERIFEWVNQKDPEAFKEFGNRLMSEFTPNGIPQAGQLPMELIANYSVFRGTKIESSKLEAKFPEDRFDEYTSMVSVAMAQTLAKAGIHVSPKKLDYAFFGLTGGLGRGVLKAADMVAKSFEGKMRPEPMLVDMPVIGAFGTRSAGSQTPVMQDFWDKLSELKMHHQRQSDSLSAGSTEPRLMSDESAAMLARLEKFNAAIQKLERVETLMRYSPREYGIANPRQLRKKLDEIKLQQIDLARQALGR